jgi:hypothetical protein
MQCKGQFSDLANNARKGLDINSNCLRLRPFGNNYTTGLYRRLCLARIIGEASNETIIPVDGGASLDAGCARLGLISQNECRAIPSASTLTGRALIAIIPTSAPQPLRNSEPSTGCYLGSRALTPYRHHRGIAASSCRVSKALPSDHDYREAHRMTGWLQYRMQG